MNVSGLASNRSAQPRPQKNTSASAWARCAAAVTVSTLIPHTGSVSVAGPPKQAGSVSKVAAHPGLHSDTVWPA